MVVDIHTLFEGGVDYQELGVLVPLDLLWGDEYEVGGEADSAHGDIDVALQPSAVIFAGLDDEKIQVGVRPHVSAGGGAEEDDPVRLGNLDDTRDYLVYDRVVRSAVLSYVFSCGCHGISESWCVLDSTEMSQYGQTCVRRATGRTARQKENGDVAKPSDDLRGPSWEDEGAHRRPIGQTPFPFQFVRLDGY